MNALKNSHQVLENERAELLKAREKIAEEKTELDLQNKRFKSAIEDLKHQNRKSEEENIALKERVDGLKEQLSKQQKPQ
ncbi:hypothetical protein HpHA275_15560 [Helicobacter pylori]